MYKNFIIPYLYEAQHVSGDTQPTIRSLKLHWQPLVFYMWKVVGCVVGGRCQAHLCLTTTQPTIRSLKLHWQPLVFHMWRVVGCVVGGRCQAQLCLTTSTNYTSKKTSTYKKSEATSAVSDS